LVALQREERDGCAGTEGERKVLFLDGEHGCRRRRGSTRRRLGRGRGSAMGVVIAQNALFCFCFLII
jgi:hypothetical protein